MRQESFLLTLDVVGGGGGGSDDSVVSFRISRFSKNIVQKGFCKGAFVICPTVLLLSALSVIVNNNRVQIFTNPSLICLQCGMENDEALSPLLQLRLGS